MTMLGRKLSMKCVDTVVEFQLQSKPFLMLLLLLKVLLYTNELSHRFDSLTCLRNDPKRNVPKDERQKVFVNLLQ